MNQNSLITDFIERRKFIRMPLQVKIAYTLEGSSELHHGLCQNISAQGLMFQTDHALPIDALITLSIDGPTSLFPPFMVSAQVMRIDESGDGKYYHVATHFTRIH